MISKKEKVLKIFFGSEFFEKKFYYARKKIGFLNKQYKNYHQLAKGFEDESLREKSLASLKIIKDATACQHDQMNKRKKIWMYWNSSLEESPEVVKLSYRSWKDLNPDYELVFLNDKLLMSKLGFDFNAVFDLCNIRLTLANKADLLRLYLLSKYGGVWVDATTFCIKPLEEWLPNIASENNFFAFRQSKVKSRPIEVWFMYADKGAPIIKNTLYLFLEYLTYERKVSIYVSNSKKKMRKLGVEKNHPCMIYAKEVYEAESFGFMPYFSLAYFLNESMNELLSDSEVKRFFDLPNFFANNDDEYDVFINSYVSKQTYKNEYQDSNTYIERKNLLCSFLKVDG